MKKTISDLFEKIGWTTHPWIDSEQVIHRTSTFNLQHLLDHPKIFGFRFLQEKDWLGIDFTFNVSKRFEDNIP